MDYQAQVEELKRLISPALEAEGALLVDFNFVRATARPILKLLVDNKEGGISIGECARLNEMIGNLLDERNIMEEGYILEVSSPGLDRPVKSKDDFLRCRNRKVLFFLNEPINGRRELEGIVVRAEEDSVYIDLEGQSVEIPLLKINKGKQVI